MSAPAFTSNYTPNQLALLRDLFSAGCVLVGDQVQRRFGLRSPIYINMREELYARPELLGRVGGEFAWKIIELANALDSAARLSQRAAENPAPPPGREPVSAIARIPAEQVVVGIPDTATPLAVATAMFSWYNRTTPRITFALLRKEAKRYPGHEPRYWLGPHQAQPDPSRDSHGAATAPGTSESIPAPDPAGAGSAPAREYTLIDDVVASGLTKRAAAEKMRAEGIPLTRIIVLFDRAQGDGLREEGFALHSIFNLSDVVNFYAAENLISPADHSRITDFLHTRRFDSEQR